jgi:hypothetical protein
VYAGHYAPALALKRWRPEVPLWQLLLAVQAVDVLFWALVPLGIERMHLDFSQPGKMSLILEYMPFSHSLAATALWALAPVLALRSGAGVALGMAVASHWFLDLPMHRPDLPLATGDGVRVGLGLWQWPLVAWAFESAVLASAVVLCWGRHRGAAWLGLALMVLEAVNDLLPSPVHTVGQMALGAEVTYLLVPAVSWWMGRNRGPRPRP